MKRPGDMKEFLGMEIVRNREKRQIFLRKSKYARKIIDKFTDGQVNPVKFFWPPKTEIPHDWKELNTFIKFGSFLSVFFVV
ncbi:gag-pol polyprotein [Fusarium langsethiae]|uniref:Gag-pol polyprotein n=1 Tax=Fusarium langsethiae TaxID=179993 RepID=A0A0M9EUA5_FUSLA|nr:gag-pol polyprotein [Fusarium langsethiae]GKU04741.1 unnamed protein product [Fusarium langsethiae]GKU20236.1 unnamed protein product [Fusarium langsethiae]